MLYSLWYVPYGGVESVEAPHTTKSTLHPETAETQARGWVRQVIDHGTLDSQGCPAIFLMDSFFDPEPGGIFGQ